MILTAHNRLPVLSVAASIPGMINENAVAASMTPAPNPSMVVVAFCDTFLAASTGSAPNAVAAAVPAVAINAALTTGLPESQRHKAE